MRIEFRNLIPDLEPAVEPFAERRMGFALGRFSNRIRRVTIRLKDLNSTRGGLDKNCQVSVSLIPRGTLLVEDTDANVYVAVARAAERIARKVARELHRARHIRRRAVISSIETRDKRPLEAGIS